MTADRVAAIRERLTERLNPEVLEIEDESHKHVGHVGAKEGKGHFKVRIVSSEFTGMGRIQRHQAIFAALGDLMATDIHALSIHALSPEEL